MLAKKICDKELGPKFVDHYIQIQSNTWLVHNKFGKLFIDAWIFTPELTSVKLHAKMIDLIY